MADAPRPLRLPRLKAWPTEDWREAPLGYRFIKATFQKPVEWTARLHVRGAHHVPSEGGVLLAVNHFSWADPILVGAAVHRPVYYLAKESLFRNPVAARFFTTMGQIKVNRLEGGNEDVVATAVRALGEGKVVGVFPEATRSRPGELKRGRPGVARIAALSGAPVVPIGLDTTTFWPRTRTLPKWGEKVYLAIGEPMRLPLKPEDAADKQKMREATDDVMACIRELLQGATRAREAGDDWT